MAGKDGVKSPKVRKALRRAIKAAGLSINQAGERVDGYGNLQRRLRGAVGVTPAYAKKFEKALELEPGSIENLVLVEAIRAKEQELSALEKATREKRMKLRESRLRLS